MEELKFLEEQHVSPALIRQVETFRNTYGTSEEALHRIVKPSIPFYGKDILEMAIAGLLQGENLQVRRQPEKISWQKTLPIFLEDLLIMFLFM